MEAVATPIADPETVAKYEPVIGLEVHVQLKTKSKIFSPSSHEFGNEPNTQTDPVVLGLPGALPVLNREAVAQGVKASLALNCRINRKSVFARKNYFYPDLPKGYQISQYDEPLAEHGWVEPELEDGTRKRIGVTRLHLEEDAGKTIHDGFRDSNLYSYVDLNRAGAPLAEIVSEPDMRSADEAFAYLTELKQIMQFAGVSDCDMEKGQLRCDANVSVRLKGVEKFGTKAEIKNVNSFRFVKMAIEYEIARQVAVIESGGQVVQETRLFNNTTGETVSMRSKEEAHDYRYFPDPDLLPLTLEQAWVDALGANLPELPDEKKQRFIADYGLTPYDANVLISDRAAAAFFEELAEGRDAKVAANWVINELAGRLNKDGHGVADSPISTAQLGGLLDLLDEGTISGKIAKELFEILWTEGGDPKEIVEARGMKQVTDTGAIEAVIDEVIAANPDKVEQVKAKPTMLGWFVGQVMKASGGKANPQAANELLKQKLGLD